ncbi:MAG: hypothetical protein V3V06_01445, partial [Dehalococcoidia bacterium]
MRNLGDLRQMAAGNQKGGAFVSFKNDRSTFATKESNAFVPAMGSPPSRRASWADAQSDPYDR